MRHTHPTRASRAAAHDHDALRTCRMGDVSDTDVELVRAFYAAMAARDFDRLFALLDPACVITQDPALPWGGRHVGHDGFANFGLTLSSTIDSTVAIDAVFEADGDVIQFGHTRGTVRANGARFDIPEVHRWTVRDGKAVAAHSPSTLRDARRVGPMTSFRSMDVLLRSTDRLPSCPVGVTPRCRPIERLVSSRLRLLVNVRGYVEE